MKAKRLLFLVMAICLASGVKAQFYDNADEIYFYVEDNNETNDKFILVFNFDGLKACVWSTLMSYMKDYLKGNPNKYEDLVEETEYELRYTSNNTYKVNNGNGNYESFLFSGDRNSLLYYHHYSDSKHDYKKKYTRVDKSFFKVGRSRTPSGTMYE